jgi:hypothetical protein
MAHHKPVGSDHDTHPLSHNGPFFETLVDRAVASYFEVSVSLSPNEVQCVAIRRNLEYGFFRPSFLLFPLRRFYAGGASL